jgi:hypothetical protein
MKSKSDFWLSLHKLATDLEREGENDSERAASVCEVLNALTDGTKSVYLANLESVRASIDVIFKECNDV